MIDKRPRTVDLSQLKGMTPGPWKVLNVHNRIHIESEKLGFLAQISLKGNWQQTADAIAALPSLIADLRATRAERDKVKDFLRDLTGMFHDGADISGGDMASVIWDHYVPEARSLLTGMEDNK